MLYVILTICFIGNIVLFWKVLNMEVKYLGETSSLKTALKEKNKEIQALNDKIQYIKNLNVDVQV